MWLFDWLFNLCFNPRHGQLVAENEALEAQNVALLAKVDGLAKQLSQAQQPLPVLDPAGTISADEYRLIIRAKMKEYGEDNAEIYPPDDHCKVYRYQDVVDRLKLDAVDKISYVQETMDCDDFAAKLFGDFAGLVWTEIHSLNFFIDDGGKFYFIEPQNSKISEHLEGWQGSHFRFFLVR